MNCLFVDIMQFSNVLDFIMGIRDANVHPFYTFIIWSSPIITPDTYNGISIVVLFHYNSLLFSALFLRNDLLENMLKHNQIPYYICLDLRRLTENICDWEVAQHLFYISVHRLGQEAQLMHDPNSLWELKMSVVDAPASDMSTGKVPPMLNIVSVLREWVICHMHICPTYSKNYWCVFDLFPLVLLNWTSVLCEPTLSCRERKREESGAGRNRSRVQLPLTEMDTDVTLSGWQLLDFYSEKDFKDQLNKK